MTESADQSGSAPVAKRMALAQSNVRWVLLAALAVVFVLAVADRLSLWEALMAAGVIAAASFLRVPAWNRALTPPQRATSSRIPFAINPQIGAVIGALPEPALLVDRRGTILAGNDAAIASLGPVRRGEPLSYTVRAPEVIEALRGTAADGQARRVEFSDRVPVERNFEAYVTRLELTGENGVVQDAYLLTFHDLTPQRRVEKMRADFVANASHELRTPLASLSGFIETLQGPARGDAAARDRFLSIMVEQARRMSRLIDDLLSLSRVELNEHVRPQTVVDLAPIVGHVCDTLSPLASERGVEMIVTGKDFQLPVQGERDELIRLVENLVENGLKYGGSGKRVEVTMEQDGSEAVVKVRDYGPGIPREHLPRLTERFYRVDAETSRAEGGTGLGLAIVKHILARHRGRLAIESELGHGAEFVARIPLSTATTS
jgi:two-component system phosphate regulon sensor histidine kinase PhoR